MHPAQPRTGQQARVAKYGLPHTSLQAPAQGERSVCRPDARGSAQQRSLSLLSSLLLEAVQQPRGAQPMARSTVRRVCCLRVCSHCILRTVSVVPSDRATLDRVLAQRQATPRQGAQARVFSQGLRRTALSRCSVRLRGAARNSAQRGTRRQD